MMGRNLQIMHKQQVAKCKKEVACTFLYLPFLFLWDMAPYHLSILELLIS